MGSGVRLWYGGEDDLPVALMLALESQTAHVCGSEGKRARALGKYGRGGWVGVGRVAGELGNGLPVGIYRA